MGFKGIIPSSGCKGSPCFDRQPLNWLYGSVLAHSKFAMFTDKLPQRKKTILYNVGASK